jgi:integrase
MKQRFILFRRAGVFYSEDTETRKQHSLRTRDEAEATAIINAKNESVRQPVLNLQIARAYLTASDPGFAQRTWQEVMAQMQTHGKDATKLRCSRAMQSKAFDGIRRKTLMETTAQDFLTILNAGKVSVAHYLRRLHNLALNLGWLAVPVLVPALWPKTHFKAKRGITFTEHQTILAAEKNSERSLFYRLLWEIGSSQSDAAALTAENIDWRTRTLTYFRMKTGEKAQLAISSALARILEQLPTEGRLFPKISAVADNARSAEFYRRCKLLGIKGVSLHSYRYAWAERAKVAGMPERFAQAALGHNSKAIHRAYAKRAEIIVPSLEDYEAKATAKVPQATKAPCNSAGLPIP